MSHNNTNERTMEEQRSADPTDERTSIRTDVSGGGSADGTPRGETVVRAENIDVW